MFTLNRFFLNELLTQNGRPLKFLSAVCLTMFCLFSLFSSSHAQWNNNPLANKLLVTGTKNPINITTAPDQLGGGFVFWEDKVDSLSTNVFFQHFNSDGSIDFRADGKPVSISSSLKNSSISCASSPMSAVVVFKDFGGDKNGELYAQRVSSKGDLLWSQYGVKLTHLEGEALYPSLTSDNEGNVFVTFIYRDYSTPANYNLYAQIIKPSGETVFNQNGLLVAQSTRIKSHPRIAADNLGGMFVFWVESLEGKAKLFVQHFDSKGRNTWANKTSLVSTGNDNVLGYSILSVSDNSVYVNWEAKKLSKDIFQQLISIDGKFLWPKDGEKVTNQYGNQTSPQAVFFRILYNTQLEQ